MGGKELAPKDVMSYHNNLAFHDSFFFSAGTNEAKKRRNNWKRGEKQNNSINRNNKNMVYRPA